MKLDNRTEKRKTGDLGENIACSFLEKKGFKIIERNYLRKWGEIDIIAQKGRVFRFIEVKSVSCATLQNVTPETMGAYRPEENVHPQKLKRLSRVIQTYLLEKGVDSDWQLDIVTVKIQMESRVARVEILENIII
ncbi:MAG: putative endonuclease [Parcubacteria bacterium C7867-005]|nr:MAG: putative endonuclease [Parcubacteria bacterium C7867-005]